MMTTNDLSNDRRRALAVPRNLTLDLRVLATDGAADELYREPYAVTVARDLFDSMDRGTLTRALASAVVPDDALPLSGRAEEHTVIRAAAASFNEARDVAWRTDEVEDLESARQAWHALGRAIADAGYVSIILDGAFYAGCFVHPEQGGLGDSDEYAVSVYRAGLILNLDA